MSIRLVSFSFLVLTLLAGGSVRAQLAVNNAQTPLQLVQDVLLGAGVTVSNVTYNGGPATAIDEQAGSFSGAAGSIGLPSGVLLSSGNVQVALGPNNAGGSTLGGGNFGFGDPDLEVLAGVSTNDASILEFDFVPVGDSITFRYVFASEEYNEYVCGTVNDVFGFFLSGPGIAGPFTDGAINLALVPGTTVPVSINTVNNGTVGANGQLANCQSLDPNWTANNIYYEDNAGSVEVQFDGQTVVLTARAQVVCGQTYHIKMAIADGGDTAFDSGVFLEAGSFSSVPFIPTLTPGPGIVGDNTILESCYPVTIDFIQQEGDGDTSVVFITVGGTATPGVDYVPNFPDSIIFLPGDTIQSFTFNCPIDPDGPETIVLTLVSQSICSAVQVVNEFEFIIESSAPLVTVGGFTSIPCLDTAVFTPAINGGYPPYEVVWSNGAQGAELTVAPLVSTVYSAIVTDDCGTVSVSQFVVEVEAEPPVPVIPTLSPGIGVVGPTTIQESCYPVTMVFTLAQSLPDTNVVEVSIGGTSTPGVDHSPLFPDSLVFLPGQTQLSVTFNCPVDDDGPETLAVTLIIRSVCSGEPVSTEFLFQIVPSAPVEATSGSATIPCEGTAVFTPVISGGFAPYEVRWSDGSTGANLTVSPLTNTTYTATVTDTCGSTTTAAFVVDLEPIQPVQFTIDGPSSLLEACEQTTLVVTRAPGVQGDLTISFGGSGEATPGADYVLPGPVVLPDGTQSIELPFAPLEDGVDDDQEEATITATVTDACGRSADSFVDLTILDAPDILVLGQDTTVVCANDSILSIVVATGGVGTLDISWSNGYTGTSAWLSTEIDADYVVTVTDDCARTAQTTISVDLVCDVVIPNVISPNGDQYNEALVIEGLQYLSHTLRIFNRWGQLVFESSDYLRRWKADGHPDGTYFYELVVEDREKPYTGHITVLR